MAATNYTPIQLYFSTTASAAPTAGNLTSGELAINITDGKLYYKDNGGVVQVIATKGAGTIGGLTTQIQYNNAGALAGNAAMTFNSGTNTTTLTTLNLTNALGAIYGGTAQSTYTQGDVLYASASNTLSKLGIGTVNYILTSSGSVPQWSAPSSISVLTATNLAGGLGGSVPYQSAVDTTTFLAIGAANRVMTSSGTAPQWVTALSGLTGVSSSSITNTSLTSGRVVYSGASGVETDSANLTFNGTTLSAGGFSTTGLSTLVQTVKIGDSNFSGVAVFAPATPAKLYIGTGTVTDATSAIGATNATGAISSLGITPIAATNTSVTYTNASTLYIAGAPSAGTNITITNPYALYVNAGTSYFDGNVGIGTSSPTSKLQVAGSGFFSSRSVPTSGAGPEIYYDGTNAGWLSYNRTTSAYIPSTFDGSQYTFNISGGNGMVLNTSGNLGLAVTPSAWNTGWVASQIGSAGSIAAIRSTTGPSVVFQNNAFLTTGGVWNYITSSPTNPATQYEQYNGNHIWYKAASGTGTISWTQAMTLDSSGKLQIASTNNTGANANLVVGTGLASADGRVVINTADTNIDAISLDNWDGAATSYGPRISFNNSGRGGFIIGASDGANNFDICQTWGTPNVRIDSSGNLLVGTTSINRLGSGATGPAFQIATSAGAEIYLSTSATASGEFVGAINFGTTGTSSAAKRSALIGSTLTAASGTNVSGNLVFYTNLAGALSERMTISEAGVVTITRGGGSSFTAIGVYNESVGTANVSIGSDGRFTRATSSLKYKKNVLDAQYGLSDVLALRPVTYEGKNPVEEGITYGGLIAEEVHALGLSQFVEYADDGTPDAVRYGNMVSLAFKAIQEQQALITQLTARITALEGA